MTQYFFESKDDFELFYCPFDYDNTREIVELHVHHTDFRLLSRIHLVKIGLYEGCEKLNLFYPKNGWEYISDENEDLRRIESWETKILNFSSKIYFNELNEREIHYLGIDSEEIKNHCNDIWKRFVSYKNLRGEGSWVSNSDIIKKKLRIWKESWVEIYYEKSQDKFYCDHPLGPDYGFSDCFGSDGNIFERKK